MNDVARSARPALSLPSIIALIAAIASFAVGAVAGMILALVAILFGFIGIVLSLSPRVRGGLLSTFSLVAGLLGVLAAVVKAIGWFAAR